MLKKFLIATMAFLLGALASVSFIGLSAVEIPAVQDLSFENSDTMLKAKERASPHDWIKESDIQLYQNGVTIDVENPQWAVFADTNSMDPIIDAGAHAIEIIPKTPDDVHVGDIVSYQSGSGTIIHRVIETGYDNYGWYAEFKGDNNPIKDPNKVRFKDIRRIVVAIVY
ncbi:hypothetical protein JW851_00980 [Candidatus Woesearchaeota archaeon]|nr:hypothetical protein [Candidatus Woesearchaeota archaeon]